MCIVESKYVSGRRRRRELDNTRGSEIITWENYVWKGKKILKWLPREAECTVLNWIQLLGAPAYNDKPFGFEKESRQFLDYVIECIH
jgi:hypothetical protein